MTDEIKKQILETIETHSKLIDQCRTSGVETIAAAAQAIIKSLKQNGTVYVCGNGGSAADAQHIAAELLGRFEHERKALPVVALTTNTSVITSVSNDYSFENIFTRQLEAFISKADLLWAISTSGNSPNVVAAAELAKEKNACVLAFTGKPESKLEETADICFCANSDSTARSQEIHQLGYHIICQIVEKAFCE